MGKRADVVIVGAGSAGCVLASRLSEDPARAVVLIEAGPDYPWPADRPAEILDGHQPAFTHDWGYASEPGALGRAIEMTRAKLVGGCSATNATFAIRGTPADYDEWRDLGNEGWSFPEVLPWFKRLERDLDFHGSDHGTDGPVVVRRYPEAEWTAVQRAFLEAVLSAGFSHVDDHNAAGSLGVGPTPMNTLEGIRQSAVITHLDPARVRPNLDIRSDVMADRVVVSKGRAVGVALAGGETIESALVVLAAGAFGSPAVLLRSGIGAPADLARLGIKCVMDAPGVGRNLVDHPLTGLSFSTPNWAPAGSPGYQVILTARSSRADGGGHDLHVFPVFNPGPNGDAPTFSIYVGVMKPRSRGSVSLTSSNPSTPPRIDDGLLADTADVDVMLEGVKLARQLARTDPLAGLVVQELVPGVDIPDAGAALEEAVRAATYTYFHPTGSCRMGPASDALSVVDDHCRVRGIAGLAVVDASILPTIPTANTNLATLMVAERCAVWLANA